jgi:hypothetical protein
MSIKELLPTVSATMIAIGLGIDLYSLALDLRRDRLGYGPSGIPMVSLLLFYLPASQMRGIVFHDGLRTAVLLAIVYLCCHFLIPVAAIRLRRGRPPNPFA